MIIKPKLDIDIQQSHINNSPIGCEIKNNIDFLDKSIKEALSVIQAEISDMGNTDLRETLEILHYQINQFYNEHKDKFINLVKYSSCSISNDPSSLQIQNIIKFWIVAKYCERTIDMNSVSDLQGKFNVHGNYMWIFSPTTSNSRSIEKSIAAIKNFLRISNSSNVANGRCYLSKITHSNKFSCSNCVNGTIELGNTEDIIEDFVDGKREPLIFKDKVLQQDFVNIQIEKKLIMKCGNCVTDIERIPDNLLKLEG